MKQLDQEEFHYLGVIFRTEEEVQQSGVAICGGEA